MTCFLLLLSLAIQASAQASAEPELRLNEAMATLRHGQESLDAMDFESARATLQRASTLLLATDLQQSHDAAFEALGLLAAATLFGGDSAEARNLLRRLLTLELSWDYPANRRSPQLATTIEAVRKELQGLARNPLSIDSTPSGAQVVVDGKALGPTPLQTPPLLPGRHVVALLQEGYETRQEQVFVSPGARLHWDLERRAVPVPASSLARSADPSTSTTAAAAAAAAVAASKSVSGLRLGAWILLGGAAAGAGVTSYLALRIGSATRHARETPQTDTAGYHTAISKASNAAFGANLAFYASLASAGAGALLLVLAPHPQGAPLSKGPRLDAALVPLDQGLMLSVGGRF